jgi:hypothetical protein
LSTILSLGGVSRRADLGHRMISTLCRRLLPSPLGSDLQRLYSMDMVEEKGGSPQKRVSHTLSAKTVDQTLDISVLGYMATAVAQFWGNPPFYRRKVTSIHLSNSAGNHGASCWRQCLPPPPNTFLADTSWSGLSSEKIVSKRVPVLDYNSHHDQHTLLRSKKT